MDTLTRSLTNYLTGARLLETKCDCDRCRGKTPRVEAQLKALHDFIRKNTQKPTR